jgi:hypothetical protein
MKPETPKFIAKAKESLKASQVLAEQSQNFVAIAEELLLE